MPRKRPKRVDYPEDYVHKVGFKGDKHQIVLTRSALTNEGEEVWRDHTYHSTWKAAISSAIKTQLCWLVNGEPESIVKEGERLLALWDQTISLVNAALAQADVEVRVPARETLETEEGTTEEDTTKEDAAEEDITDDALFDL